MRTPVILSRCGTTAPQRSTSRSYRPLAHVSSRRFTSPRGKKLTGLARKYPLDRASPVRGHAFRLSGAPSRQGHILLAGPTPETFASTTATLAGAGYRIATVFGVDEALQVMARERIDLLIIVCTGGCDSIAQRLRCIRQHEGIARPATDPAAVGILVLTDREAPRNDARRRAALAEGADDVLVAPFPPAELVLRVATLLRRMARVPAVQREMLILADMHIDIAAHEVVVGERIVDLTPAEFTMLRTLAERPGHLFARDSLVTTGRATARGVDMRISRLRRKLDGAGVVIECVRGTGYRLSVLRTVAP